MSTHTFVDALIGLAREYKTAQRRVLRFNKNNEVRLRPRRDPPPAFGHEVSARMVETGYFAKAEAEVFGDALQGLLEASDPRRKKP